MLKEQDSSILRIGDPIVTRIGDVVRYEVSVDPGYPAPQRLWFEIAGAAGMVSKRADAAILTLLIPAMTIGAALRTRAAVTAELAHQVRHGCQQVLQAVNPCLQLIDLVTDLEVPAGPPEPGVLTGFSAGIDSFAALADYYWAEHLPQSLRVTHIVHSNVGAHGRDGGGRLFRARQAKVAPLVADFGLPLISVDSNVEEFYTSFYGILDFDRTHSLRNAAVAFLLQAGVGRMLYASSTSLRSVAVHESDFLSVVDPVLLPMASTPNLDLRSVGSEYTRVQKTLNVAELPPAWTTLEVCAGQQSAGNCSVCHKCLRTLLTLEIAGLLDRFASVFELDRYAQAREQYLIHVHADAQDPFQTEILELAAARGFRFPAAAVWTGRARQARQAVRRRAATVRGAVTQPGARAT